MLISDFIAMLENLRTEHGEIDMVVPAHDFYGDMNGYNDPIITDTGIDYEGYRMYMITE